MKDFPYAGKDELELNEKTIGYIEQQLKENRQPAEKDFLKSELVKLYHEQGMNYKLVGKLDKANEYLKQARALYGEVVQRKDPIHYDEVKALIENITTVLKIDQTKGNPVDKFIWIPYGQSLLKVFPENETPPFSLLQNNLALVLQDLGDYVGALTLAEKALTVFIKTLPPGHPDIKWAQGIYESIKKQTGDT